MEGYSVNQPNRPRRPRAPNRRASSFAVGFLVCLLTAGTSLAVGPPAQPPEDAEVSPSGLASQVLQVGTGESSPDANDLVMAHFVGWSPDGEEFQNTYLTGQPQLFNLEQVFAGWREGLQLMVSGEKRRLWIPDHLGAPNPEKGPRGAAIFDVELLAKKSVPNPPPTGTVPPPDAERLPLGAYTKVSFSGTGEEHPGPRGRVLAHYIGWGQDGKIFDSTLHRNRPTAFMLDLMLSSFAEGVRQMVVGERRYLWIPESLAAGQWPKAPKGDLLFEVELLRILPDEALQPKPRAEADSEN